MDLNLERAERKHEVPEVQGAARGLIRLRVAVGVYRSFLSSLVMRFVAEHPAIRINVAFSNGMDDLASRRFDLALTADRLMNSKLMARQVAHPSWWLFAAPAYLETNPPLSSPGDLKKHKCILQNPRAESQTLPLIGPGGLKRVGVTGAVYSDDPLFIHELALRGAGVALFPAILGIDDLQRGTLVRMLPGYEVPGPAFHLLLPSRSRLPLRVALFREALIEGFTKSTFPISLK